MSGREMGKEMSVSCHHPWTRMQRALAKFSLVPLGTEIYEKVFPNLALLFPRFLSPLRMSLLLLARSTTYKNEENP